MPRSAAAALVGVVTVVRHDGLKVRHKADLVAMYVTPAVRGQGVGRALMEAAIDAGAEHG